MSDYSDLEANLITAELMLDATYDDPAATAADIAMVEADHAEARVAYADAVAADPHGAEAPEPEAEL